nr:RNA-directed DNA polymerase, eukaryota, reverse transcriptase zinc-binding domain protein [Tanacetum cinerariifolium]
SVLVNGSPTDEFRFQRASDLTVNFHKSQLMGVRVPINVVEVMASLIGCKASKFPVSYLGVQVGDNMNRIESWRKVVDKITNKLSSWKVKTLLVGGAEIDERKMTWISWKKVLDHKQDGGLGVNSIYALNQALLFKWIWRFRNYPNALWVQVVKAIHGEDGKLSFNFRRSYPNTVWIQIVKAISNLKEKEVDLLSFCKKKLGDGCDTQFWIENWIGDQTLKFMLHRLFALETNTLISMAERKRQGIGLASFLRHVRGGVESTQWEEMLELLDTVHLSSMADKWAWTLHDMGSFTVSSARVFIDNKYLITSGEPTSWCNLIPIKINVMT